MDKQEKPKTVIIGGPSGEGCPGSRSFPCAACGKPAWLAITSQRIVRENASTGVKILCFWCGLTSLIIDPEFNLQLPTFESLLEDTGRTPRN